MNLFHNRYEIEVLGRSSDGDERLLKSMKARAKLDLMPTSDLSQNSSLNRPTDVQDSIHVARKLRNRLLNSSILLQMGNKVASVAHIKMLLSSVPKEIHGLVLSDVCPDDRQNYSSYEKITDQCVLQSLKNSIVDSEATIMYLVLCKQITSSYLEVNLKPIDRIYKIWHAVYFFRCWREWIQLADNEFSLGLNFVSNNAYSCVELNAHALIYLILRLRRTERNAFFLPYLFSSQPCEHTFRQMRSMGTANFTKINFTLNELLHMIARVEMMNKVIHSNRNITFPRIDKKSKISLKTEAKIDNKLPNDEDILNAIKKAQIDALKRLLNSE